MSAPDSTIAQIDADIERLSEIKYGIENDIMALQDQLAEANKTICRLKNVRQEYEVLRQIARQKNSAGCVER